MNFTKPATSVTDQITLLKSRGLQFPNESEASHFLQHHNYVRLRTYWYTFETDHQRHTLKAGTTFEDIIELYTFDRELRLLVLDAIEQIEISFRTQFVYHFANFLHPFAYLDVQYSKNRRFFQQNLNSLQEEVRRSHEVFIAHYKNKYTDPLMPPIWMVCEVMSLGLLSRWYKNLKPASIRQAIAQTYDIDNRALEGVLHHMTEIRNVSAHHSRLWDRNFVFRLPLPQTKPAQLRRNMNLTRQDNLYNTLVMMVHFMDVIYPNHTWKRRLLGLLGNFSVDPITMGFPKNWQTLPIWQR
jgi:abortive infection bacteriophage resistance protein